MYYLNPQGEKVTIATPYEVDIATDVLLAGSKAVKNFGTGWFKQNAKFPCGIFYTLSSSLNEYFSGNPSIVKFTYYFEVRAKKESERDSMAKALSAALSSIYSARRSQYFDSFEDKTDTYIKRMEFTFTVNLRNT